MTGQPQQVLRGKVALVAGATRGAGRGIAVELRALAADPDKMSRTGTVTSTWDLYPVYGFTDVDGSQPDWGAYARETLGMDA
jgi:hypothetical protein